MSEEKKSGCGCTQHTNEQEHTHKHAHGGCGCHHGHAHEEGCGCHHHEHSHKEGCGCHHGHEHHYEEGEVGCGCHHEHDEPVNIVKLIDDEGKPHECLHIATLEWKDKWYAIFQAMEEDDADEDTVTILQIVEDGEEEKLLPIEDQATLDAVFEEFCRLMDEEEEA